MFTLASLFKLKVGGKWLGARAPLLFHQPPIELRKSILKSSVVFEERLLFTEVMVFRDSFYFICYSIFLIATSYYDFHFWSK